MSWLPTTMRRWHWEPGRVKKSDVLFSVWRISHSWFSLNQLFLWDINSDIYCIMAMNMIRMIGILSRFNFNAGHLCNKLENSRHALIRQRNPLPVFLPLRHSGAEWWRTLCSQRAICKRCEPHEHCNFPCASDMTLESGIIGFYNLLYISHNFFICYSLQRQSLACHDIVT